MLLISLRIQSECAKMRTRITLSTDSFLQSSVETLTNIPFSTLFVHFFLNFLISILCSLSILRFSYLSARFLNNSNKNKNCGIVLSLLNLVKKHCQSEAKIRRIQIQGKVNRGQLIYCHRYIFICFLVTFLQSHLLIILLQNFSIFLKFQVPEGNHFSLSTHLRCFSPKFMFFSECTFEEFMQCSFKTGSRNPRGGVVFSQQIITLGSCH